MAKKIHTQTAKGSMDFAQKHASLTKDGFVPVVSPGRYTHRHGGGEAKNWGDYVHSQLRGGEKVDGRKERQDVPTLFASSGNENKAGAEKIGTDGLGWMEWGNGNAWPNVCALLTNMLPYTAAGLKFNTDLLEGMGPQPMYRYTQYVGGNITSKEIPFSDAGTLLKGWMRDLEKKISDCENVAEGQPATSAEYVASLKSDLALQKADYDKWVETDAALKVFLEDNALHEVFLPLAGDQQMLGICFPELLLNQQAIDENTKRPVSTSQWEPKIVGIRYRRAHICRLERMDKNDRINYVYLSNRWLDKPYIETGSNTPDIAALPALSVQSPLADLREAVRVARQKNVSVANRPTRFIMPVYYPTVGRPYYPVPAWHSIFGGSIFEYASTLIDDRLRRKKNSNIIGRVIYIHNYYLMSLYNQQGIDGDKQRIDDLRDTLYKEINDWLSNSDNAGQSLIGFNFIGPDGKEHKSFEIVEIESNDKNTAEANQKELQEISSIIFFAMGTDSKLIGNTPGDTTSGGGTDQRERYLIKQVQMSSTQKLLLKPLEVVSRYNEWDDHLVWRISREVLTTLDNSKTGITQAETE